MTALVLIAALNGCGRASSDNNNSDLSAMSGSDTFDPNVPTDIFDDSNQTVSTTTDYNSPLTESQNSCISSDEALFFGVNNLTNGYGVVTNTGSGSACATSSVDPTQLWSAGVDTLSLMNYCLERALAQAPTSSDVQSVAAATLIAEHMIIRCARRILQATRQYTNWHPFLDQGFAASDAALYSLYGNR